MFRKSFCCSVCFRLCYLISRNSHLEVFCKNGALKLFIKFNWKKNVSESLHNKVSGIRKCTLLHIFSCAFHKTFQYTFFTKHFWATFSKKESYWISAFVQSLFSTKKSSKVVNLLLTDQTLCLNFWRHKQDKWLFQFSKLSEVFMYIFNSLAKSYALFWKYS